MTSLFIGPPTDPLWTPIDPYGLPMDPIDTLWTLYGPPVVAPMETRYTHEHAHTNNERGG